MLALTCGNVCPKWPGAGVAPPPEGEKLAAWRTRPMTDRYLSVARSGVRELEIKRSRFLCAVAPVTSEEAAREFIAARRRADPGARHHCHAFVLGADGRTRRSSDD